MRRILQIVSGVAGFVLSSVLIAAMSSYVINYHVASPDELRTRLIIITTLSGILIGVLGLLVSLMHPSENILAWAIVSLVFLALPLIALIFSLTSMQADSGWLKENQQSIYGWLSIAGIVNLILWLVMFFYTFKYGSEY